MYFEQNCRNPKSWNMKIRRESGEHLDYSSLKIPSSTRKQYESDRKEKFIQSPIQLMTV